MPVRVTMTGRLDECVVLWYRTPADSVRGLVPSGLELVTKEAGGREWAFWNIVVGCLDEMRPAGTPAKLGVGYCHVGYRLLVVAKLAEERTQRGLYATRSDANRRILGWAGSRASEFKVRSARIEIKKEEGKLNAKVRSRDHLGDAELEVDLREEPELLPGSAFKSVREAARFLKNEPVSMAVDKSGRKVRLAEVERRGWAEDLVKVNSVRWEYLDRIGQHHIALELAMQVKAAEYLWRLGEVERLEEKGK